MSQRVGPEIAKTTVTATSAAIGHAHHATARSSAPRIDRGIQGIELGDNMRR